MTRQLFSYLLMLIGFTITSQAQEAQKLRPKFWYGVSTAANFNFYSGTTQRLNTTLRAPEAFHKGFGVAPYGSVLFEYRPDGMLGLMLNLAYDGRGGSFKGVTAPCNCPASLNTKLSYITIEPSLRITPFSSDLYLFIGGAYSYNVDKSFTYTQRLKPDTKADFSNIATSVFSGQVGVGYEILLSSTINPNQVYLSPFISYHPYFGQAPRTTESWSLTTLRVGTALKFGRAH